MTIFWDSTSSRARRHHNTRSCVYEKERWEMKNELHNFKHFSSTLPSYVTFIQLSTLTAVRCVRLFPTEKCFWSVNEFFLSSNLLAINFCLLRIHVEFSFPDTLLFLSLLFTWRTSNWLFFVLGCFRNLKRNLVIFFLFVLFTHLLYIIYLCLLFLHTEQFSIEIFYRYS